MNYFGAVGASAPKADKQQQQLAEAVVVCSAFNCTVVVVAVTLAVGGHN